MKTKTWFVEWANGGEAVKGLSLEEAVGKIKTPPMEIVTGWLVRVKSIDEHSGAWAYWDAEKFWKCLKGKTKLVRVGA